MSKLKSISIHGIPVHVLRELVAASTLVRHEVYDVSSSEIQVGIYRASDGPYLIQLPNSTQNTGDCFDSIRFVDNGLIDGDCQWIPTWHDSPYCVGEIVYSTCRDFFHLDFTQQLPILIEQGIYCIEQLKELTSVPNENLIEYGLGANLDEYREFSGLLYRLPNRGGNPIWEYCGVEIAGSTAFELPTWDFGEYDIQDLPDDLQHRIKVLAGKERAVRVPFSVPNPL